MKCVYFVTNLPPSSDSSESGLTRTNPTFKKPVYTIFPVFLNLNISTSDFLQTVSGEEVAEDLTSSFVWPKRPFFRFINK